MLYPHGNTIVPYGTPTHVTEIMLLVLKTAFNCLPAGHPYKYEDDYDSTGILFDVNINKASDVWGKKPVIIVSRGNQGIGVAMVGDMATRNIAMNSWEGSNLVDSSIELKIISKARAEAESVAQLAFCYLMTSRTILPRLCGVHNVPAISMSPVQKMQQDDEIFLVQIQMMYTMQMAWQITNPVTLLQAVTAHLKTPIHSQTATSTATSYTQNVKVVAEESDNTTNNN